ncbi:hypothetical protein HZS_4955 [Henneguya salminicola]|nr:hypothetical protein HZS_4955 [Henneguya salminicola]
MEIPNESKDKVDESTVKTLIIKNMNETFMRLEKFLLIIEECDPNGERISLVGRTIKKDTSCYKELYNGKKINRAIQFTLEKSRIITVRQILKDSFL